MLSEKLTEISGLAASEQYPNTLWAHNDSGHSTSLFAFDLEGTSLTRVELNSQSVDIEDMALSQGIVYLADIGDNNSKRQNIEILRFSEPSPSDPPGTTISDYEAITLTYPDGPHDAEAFLVDTDGTMVLLTKESDSKNLARANPSQIFVAEPPIRWGDSQELRHAGTLDLVPAYSSNPDASQSLLAFGELKRLVTGADMRADGQVVAVRNYSNVWLFERESSMSIADALQGVPCDAPIPTEPQGESVAFLNPDSNAIVTVSEGVNPPVNVSRTD